MGGLNDVVDGDIREGFVLPRYLKYVSLTDVAWEEESDKVYASFFCAHFCAGSGSSGGHANLIGPANWSLYWVMYSSALGIFPP